MNNQVVSLIQWKRVGERHGEVVRGNEMSASQPVTEDTVQYRAPIVSGLRATSCTCPCSGTTARIEISRAGRIRDIILPGRGRIEATIARTLPIAIILLTSSSGLFQPACDEAYEAAGEVVSQASTSE